jgi:hypothetical protein
MGTFMRIRRASPGICKLGEAGRRFGSFDPRGSPALIHLGNEKGDEGGNKGHKDTSGEVMGLEIKDLLSYVGSYLGELHGPEPHKIFGEQLAVGSFTIIPVIESKLWGKRPMGYLKIETNEVKWVPILDLSRIIYMLGLLTVNILGTIRYLSRLKARLRK